MGLVALKKTAVVPALKMLFVGAAPPEASDTVKPVGVGLAV